MLIFWAFYAFSSARFFVKKMLKTMLFSLENAQKCSFVSRQIFRVDKTDDADSEMTVCNDLWRPTEGPWCWIKPGFTFRKRFIERRHALEQQSSWSCPSFDGLGYSSSLQNALFLLFSVENAQKCRCAKKMLFDPKNAKKNASIIYPSLADKS